MTDLEKFKVLMKELNIEITETNSGKYIVINVGAEDFDFDMVGKFVCEEPNEDYMTYDDYRDMREDR